MKDFSNTNKTIAINTFYLYVRMVLILLITLYSSRVVLQQLGVVDFGIYNVVGSLVLMFTFIKGALTSSTSRFLAYEIGLGDDGNVSKVFSMSVNIHVVFALIVLLCCETFGIWYFYCEMNIPLERERAAFWVFQMSNLSAIFAILSVPYQGIIVAYEAMKSFAYLSLLDALMKLGVALALYVSPCDKVVFYAALLLVESVVVQLLYVVYCIRHFDKTEYRFVWDGDLFRNMFAFSGWSVGSYLSTAFVGQCVNLILNVFFGPVVNAARAVAFQVQSAVSNFVSSFQVAMNPQIIKNCACGDYNRMHSLIMMSMKVSFALLFFMAYPLLCSLEFVLDLWLVDVPEHTVLFVRIIMLSAVLVSVTNSLSVAAEASNRLKLFNGITTPYYLSSLLVCYLCFRLGCAPYVAFVIVLVYDIVGFFIKLAIVHSIIGLLPIPCVWLFAKMASIVLCAYLLEMLVCDVMGNGWCGFLLRTTFCCVYSALVTMFVVFDKRELAGLVGMVKRK